MSAAKKLPPIRGARRRIRPEDLLTRGMIPRRAVNDNMPDPANDNPLRVPKSDIARKSRAIGRRLVRYSPVGKALDAALSLPDYIPGKLGVRIPGGWEQTSNCPSSRPPTHWGTVSTVNSCLGGQAMAATAMGVPDPGTLEWVMPGGLTRITFAKATHYTTAGGYSRGIRGDGYRLRAGAAADPSPWSFPRVNVRPAHLNPWVNPNVQRGTPTEVPFPEAMPEPEPWPDPLHKAVEVTVHETGQVTIRTVQPSRRKPPGRKESERKARGKVTLGQWVFGALDNLSEGSEVIDAIYGALPLGIRIAAEKAARDKSPLDAFGQYGIAGLDWKIPVIIDNWDKVDINAALKGIVKNQIEDQLIGLKERLRPRNTINAMTEADKAYAKVVDDLLTEIGFD